MATAIWPLENGHWKMAKKRSTKNTAIVFALLRLFSLVFDRFCTFSLVFALFGLSVSDRFWPTIFALFFAPFACCHVVAHVRIYAPHVFALKLIPQTPGFYGIWLKSGKNPKGPKIEKNQDLEIFKRD